MSTLFKIDHIVIMVDDLSTAMDNYTTLGFNVLPGGTHSPNPTHNALVVFADGAYLEIIALQPGVGDDAHMSQRLQKWVQARPGLVDMALLPPDIEADIVEARNRGVVIENAVPSGRLRPDGQRIEWKTANLKGGGLPFFCADVTPRALRVPAGEAQEHLNGVAGVADVTIAVTDLATSTSQYQALLGVEPQSHAASSSLEAHTKSFSLGQTIITLAQPATLNSPLQAYIAAAGERPYSISLRTTQSAKSGNLDLELTQQTRINLVVG